MLMTNKNRFHSFLNSKPAYFLIFLTILLLGLHRGIMQAIGWDFHALPGDYGDVRFINCILEHDWQWLMGRTDGLFQANFMFPEKNAITFSDHLLGHLPFYAPFRIIGLAPFHSLQGWLLVTIILNFITGWYAFHYFFNNKWYALLATYLFTFSLATLSQYVHIQMAARYCIPLCFVFLNKYLNSFNRRHLLVTSMILLYQFYSSFYLGYLLFFTVMVYTILYFVLFSPKKEQGIQMLLHLIPAVGLFVTLALPMILPYAERSQSLGFVDFKNILPTVPNVYSYLRPFFGTSFWPLFHFNLEHNPVSWMHLLFPGGLIVIGLLLLPYVLIKYRNKQLLFLVLVTLITWLCFLQINEFSLLQFIRHIPGMGVVRIGTRIINILLFFFPLISVFSFQLLLSKLHLNQQTMACMALILLAFVDNSNDFNAYSKMTYTENQKRIDDLTNDIQLHFDPTQHKAFAIVMENGTDETFNKLQIDAMLASSALNLKTVNAYSSFAPSDFNVFWGQKNKKALLHWLNVNQVDSNAVLILSR